MLKKGKEKNKNDFVNFELKETSGNFINKKI